MPRVRVVHGPDKGREAEIGASMLTLGRDPACSVALNDKGASRQHAQLFRIGEMSFIRDLESRNGTFVNDVRVGEEMLRDGDRIQIGATVLVFENAGELAPRGFEFVEGEPADAVELRLEDLSSINVDETAAASTRHLRALFRLGRIVAAEGDEKALLAKALPFIARTLHADGAHVFVRDPRRHAITPIGSWTADPARPAGKISRTIIRRAITDQRALLTGNAMIDQRFSVRDSIMLKNIHSVICAPLTVSGHLQGVLYLSANDDADAFGEDDLEFAAALADQLGLAISHHRAEARRVDDLLSAVRALVRASERRFGGRQGHSERLAGYALALARMLDLPVDLRRNLQLAALLHHCGRMILPPEEAEEEGALTRATLDMVRDMTCYPDVEPILRYRLERLDGKGPERLAGTAIPKGARVLAVVHEFEALTQAAAEDGAVPPARLGEAVAAIAAEASTRFDPEVAVALSATHEDGRLYQTLDEQWHPAAADADEDIPDA